MKRFAKTILATLIPSLIAASTANAATPAANVSPAERAKIESVVHDYLVSNPQVIVEAVQTLQRKQYEQAEQTVKQTQKIAPQFANALFNQKGDPMAGNPDGAITIVEFFDYQCPHCVDMAPVIDSIIKANPNVRYIFKEFPIRGPVSDFASRAAIAANMQGKYYVFSHALLTAKQEPLTQDSILKIAKDAGLDVDKLKKDMDGDAVASQLKANIKLAQDLKLFGTPAFFISKSKNTTNVAYVPGQMNQQQMQAAIDTANK